MALVTKALKSTVRPVKAAVRPSKFVTEAPMFLKPTMNSNTLLPMPVHHAVAEHHGRDAHEEIIFGGVKTHPAPATVPFVNTKEMVEAFHRWKDFQIVPPGAASEAFGIVKSMITDKLPQSKH
mmetsp:Transcript_114974/g.325655  ORF Transcript_114974/g.325655 Transcript_114974/m.325655 type:complete len:123 (+) Transcript_114974:89-457(+)